MFTQRLWLWIFIEAYLSFPNAGNKPRDLRTRMDKLWHIHTMEYYSGINGNTLLICRTTWMNHKCILLYERNLAPQAAYCRILLIGHWTGQAIRMESRQVVARSWVLGGRLSGKTGILWQSGRWKIELFSKEPWQSIKDYSFVRTP